MNNSDLKLLVHIGRLRENKEIITVCKLASLMSVSRQYIYYVMSVSKINYKRIIKEHNENIKLMNFNNLPEEEKNKILRKKILFEQRKINSKNYRDLKEKIKTRVEKIDVDELNQLTRREILRKINIEDTNRALHILNALNIPYKKNARGVRCKTIKTLKALENLDTKNMTIKEIADQLGINLGHLTGVIYNYKIKFKKIKGN